MLEISSNIKNKIPKPGSISFEDRITKSVPYDWGYGSTPRTEEMPIFIKPGELIVGDANGSPDEIRWYPETSTWWMPEGITTGGFSEMVNEEERKEIIEDICEYWIDLAPETQDSIIVRTEQFLG